VKILAVSDEECAALWDYYVPGRLSEYDLILSCGHLKSDYLSFLVTMGRAPVLYVHGNHDTGYDRYPPEGCDCIDDQIVVYNGIRILGLGGCRKYHPGQHQYTEAQMRRRIAKLRYRLWRLGGVDIVVTHAPPLGVGDAEDPAHVGFQALLELLDQYKPKYLLHGHVHLTYGPDKTRVRQYQHTQVINVSERYVLDLPDVEVLPKYKNQLLWKTKPNRS
jgi:Icc-related predicted phosphoesterase